MTKKRIDYINELPKWFDLKKYDDCKNFNTSDWATELSNRTDEHSITEAISSGNDIFENIPRLNNHSHIGGGVRLKFPKLGKGESSIGTVAEACEKNNTHLLTQAQLLFEIKENNNNSFTKAQLLYELTKRAIAHEQLVKTDTENYIKGKKDYYDNLVSSNRMTKEEGLLKKKHVIGKAIITNARERLITPLNWGHIFARYPLDRLEELSNDFDNSWDLPIDCEEPYLEQENRDSTMDYFGFTDMIIKVNLEADDKSIIKSFKETLKAYRNVKNKKPPRRKVTSNNIKNLHSYKVLPYLDLKLWCKINDKTIKRDILGIALKVGDLTNTIRLAEISTTTEFINSLKEL